MIGVAEHIMIYIAHTYGNIIASSAGKCDIAYKYKVGVSSLTQICNGTPIRSQRQITAGIAIIMQFYM